MIREFRYRCYEVYSGQGDSYEKYGIYANKQEAVRHVERLAEKNYGARIHEYKDLNFQGLEDCIEDNLTESQAEPFIQKYED